jgi:hypothetical protein
MSVAAIFAVGPCLTEVVLGSANIGNRPDLIMFAEEEQVCNRKSEFLVIPFSGKLILDRWTVATSVIIWSKQDLGQFRRMSILS